MKLTVIERLALLNVLPAKGDATTLKIVRTLREDLSFSEEEHAELNFRQEGELLHWNTTDQTKDVEFGPKAMALLVENLAELDKRKELDATTLPLYERFLEDTTE